MQPSQFTIEVPRTGRQAEVWRKGGGRDLVFLPGPWGLSTWTPDLEALAQNYRVTVPFFPGFGRSDGEQDIRDILDAALHMFDVLEALRIHRPLLAGHSFGGMLAAEMAAICPREIDRLILLSPLGLWEEEHPVLDFFTLPPHELVKYLFHDLSHPAAVAMAVEPDPEDEALVDMFVDLIRCLSSAGRLLWPIPERGLVSRLDRITAPTLIVWGEGDELNPFHYARLFQKAIPGSRLRTFKNAGHLLTVEQARPVAAAIHQFIKGEVAPPPRIRKDPVRITISTLKNAARRAHTKVLAARAEESGAAKTESGGTAKKPAAKKPEAKKSEARKQVKQAAAKKSAPKKSAPKKPAKKSAPKKSAPKKSAKKAAAKKPVKKGSAKKPVKKSAPKKSAPKKSAKKVAPKKSAPQKSVKKSVKKPASAAKAKKKKSRR